MVHSYASPMSNFRVVRCYGKLAAFVVEPDRCGACVVPLLSRGRDLSILLLSLRGVANSMGGRLSLNSRLSAVERPGYWNFDIRLRCIWYVTEWRARGRGLGVLLRFVSSFEGTRPGCFRFATSPSEVYWKGYSRFPLTSGHACSLQQGRMSRGDTVERC